MFSKEKLDINKLVLIKSSAEGYYSDATRSEYAVLPLSVYQANKEALDKFNMVYNELDGKHSETDADIEIIVKPTLDQLNDVICNFGDVYSLIDCLSYEIKASDRELYNFKDLVEEKIKSEISKLNPEEQEMLDNFKNLDNSTKDLFFQLIKNNKLIELLKQNDLT